MRISGWSSDVCSSDLEADHRQQQDKKDPQNLTACAGAGAEHVHDGPDVEGQDDKAEDTADFEIHDPSPARCRYVARTTLKAGSCSGGGTREPGSCRNPSRWINSNGSAQSSEKEIGKASCRERVGKYV